MYCSLSRDLVRSVQWIWSSCWFKTFHIRSVTSYSQKAEKKRKNGGGERRELTACSTHPLRNTPLFSDHKPVLASTGACSSPLCGSGWPLASLVWNKQHRGLFSQHWAIVLGILGIEPKPWYLSSTAVPLWCSSSPSCFFFILFWDKGFVSYQTDLELLLIMVGWCMGPYEALWPLPLCIWDYRPVTSLQDTMC